MGLTDLDPTATTDAAAPAADEDVPAAPAGPTASEPPPSVALDDPALYFNRELSWLDFDDRVLQLAEDPSQPLLERAKFLAIFASNLDEFFMIRVAGVHDQVDAGVDARSRDDLAPTEVLDRIRRACLALYERHARAWEAVRQELTEHEIRVLRCADVDDEDRIALAERYERQIFPMLTPLAVGAGRPFPYISNLSLSLAVLVRDPDTGAETFARVKVPTELQWRFIQLNREKSLFVPLEEVIAANLGSLFPGMEVVSHGVFRVTRDADFTVSDEADDLLRAVEDQLRRRRFGEVIRLEIEAGMDERLRRQIIDALEVDDDQVYEIDGQLDLTGLWELWKLPGHKDLHDEPWSAITQPVLRSEEGDTVDVFAAMRERDILVHHPYDSFSTSVARFVEQAVEDPDVLAIKQTVYRTSDDSPLVPALIRATERGKQAVCLVELKARFDERANIGWARRLEEAGVHVVYGIPGLKTHAKCLLVVRREGDGVRHYVHVGTGNYHPTTSRIYTDFGLFTTDPDLGADVADMFNFLTGYSRPRQARKVLLAPSGLRDGILARIERCVSAHERGEPARIRMKMNSLVDGECIEALYRASRAGVPVELNVRGICCLRPGVPGVSENIRVVSVVGRFLEHSRIYAFEAGDACEVLIGSADLMPRNLDTRVELLCPIEDAACRGEILDVLDRSLADDTSAWDLGEDGAWVRRTPDPDEPRSVQRELMEHYAARGVELSGASG